MKKRFVCFLLALIMVVGMVPVAALTASAASYTLTESAITVIKKLTPYKAYCYTVAHTQTVRIGYGTECPYDHDTNMLGDPVCLDENGKPMTGTNPHHYMGQKAADAALREALAKIDKNVDSFASSNGINLSQRQHDALVTLTYCVGSAWMNGSSAVKTAIKSGANSAELLAAIAKTYGVDPLNQSDATVQRAKVVVNMYMNGVYSNIVPTNITIVKYDPNATDATIAGLAPGAIYEYYFDSNVVQGHPLVPTRYGYTFMGWYLPGDLFMANLTKECAGQTLYARWQAVEDTTKGDILYTSDIKAAIGDTKAYKRDEKTKKDVLTGELTSANIDRIRIVNTYIDSEGNKWAQIGTTKALYINDGWYDAAKTKNYDYSKWANNWVMVAKAGSVVNTTVASTFKMSALLSKRMYSAPSTGEDTGKNIDDVYAFIKVDREFIGSDGYRWVRIEKVNVSGSDTTWQGYTASPTTDAQKLANKHIGKWVIVKTGANAGIAVGADANAVAKATVQGTGGYLNVRSGAGTGYGIVGSVREGETLNVYEIKTANGHKWGRIASGWICLTYTNLVMLNGSTDVDVSTEGLTYTFSGARITNNGLVSTTKTDEHTGKSVTVWYANAYVSPSISANTAPYCDQLNPGKSVTIVGMTLDASSNLWVKAAWTATYYADTDLLHKTPLTKTAYGWIMITENNPNKGYADADILPCTHTLGASSHPVQMDPVRYTVASDEITARDTAYSGADVVFKMNKGVQFNAWEIALKGEEVWGYTRELVNVNDKYVADSDSDSADDIYEEGWVNLSTRYVSRTALPAAPGTGTTSLSPIGKTATIINTDSVNCRICAGTYGRIVGHLARGTKANVLEVSGSWYNLDVDVDKNPKTGTWVHKDYVQIEDGYVASEGSNVVTVDNGNGTTTTTSTVGKGLIANTYAGANFRQGPGMSYASIGKLLPGTPVDILETRKGGAADWAKVRADGKEGWVCMDYISTLSTTTTTTTTTTGNGTGVKDFENVASSATTAVYTGRIVVGDEKEIDTSWTAADGIRVWKTTAHNQDPKFNVVRTLQAGDSVTIYELLAVTEKVVNTEDTDDQQKDGDANGHGGKIEFTITSYWARTNDGYIYNPQLNVFLYALDQKVHTLTGSDTLNVRSLPNGDEIVGKLEKGDQVEVTNLVIVNDKVWGQIEYEYGAYSEGSEKGFDKGWIRLDYMAEGGYYIEKTETTTTTTGVTPSTMGNTGNTYSGGFVGTGSKGYRYTGKVINTNELNVRNSASSNAGITTKLKAGASLVIYETTISENMAWGRCDAGWVYLYYVDLTPVMSGALDARVVYNDNTPIYSDNAGSSTVGTYARMSVIDIYEIVGKMARTDLGWVNTDNLL